MEQKPSLDQISPVGDWLVIQPLDVPEVSDGGIVMPNQNSNIDSYGKVVKVGPGFYQNGVRVSPDVKEGDTVLFRKGRGLTLTFKQEKCLFMTERDLLAIIRS